MILDWPDTLPRPERDSWQMQPQDARRKRQSDAGPPGYRRRFSSVARMVSLSLMLDRNQKAVFDQFYHSDCAEGSHLFRLPDPTTDGWDLLSSNGLTLMSGSVPILLAETWLCSWGGQVPVETVKGIEFRKAFSIVVMP